MANVVGLSPAARDFRAIMAVNLVGASRMAQAFAEVLEPGGAGVFISSSAAHMQTMPEALLPPLAELTKKADETGLDAREWIELGVLNTEMNLDKRLAAERASAEARTADETTSEISAPQRSVSVANIHNVASFAASASSPSGSQARRSASIAPSASAVMKKMAGDWGGGTRPAFSRIIASRSWPSAKPMPKERKRSGLRKSIRDSPETLPALPMRLWTLPSAERAPQASRLRRNVEQLR